MTDQEFYERLVVTWAPNSGGPPSGNAIADGLPWERLTDAERGVVGQMHRAYFDNEEDY